MSFIFFYDIFAHMKPKAILFIPLLIIQLQTFIVNAQDESVDETTSVEYKGAKGFHLGFYLGAFFPDKKSTVVYDGYGYDENGNKRDFSNSFMYRKIIQENDPANGITDRIATELGVVNHEDWRFNEGDMPTNLKYSTGFLFGLAMHYGIDNQQAIIANLNFAKLRVVGNFTIETRNSFNQQLQGWTNNQFAIVGGEQRMLVQLGYSRILGKSEKLNFFIEGGLCLNNAKVEKNFVQINSLEIDLTNFDQHSQGLSTLYYEQYTGWGFGGFAGIGLNLTMNPKYTIQILYTPTYEKVNLGPDPETVLQHATGLRAYYNF